MSKYYIQDRRVEVLKSYVDSSNVEVLSVKSHSL